MSDRIKPEKNISSFKYPWDDLSPHLVSSAAGPYCIVGIDLLFEWQTPNQVSVSMDHAILFHLFLPASFKGLEITLILNDLSFKTDKYIYSTYRYYWLFMSSKNSKFHLCISKLHHFCITYYKKDLGSYKKIVKWTFAFKILEF